MSTGQAAGAVIGAVIGSFTPVGPVVGAQIGATIGGLLDPPKGPTVSGPRISDLSWQQSSYGANIPRVYGTVALSGNVVWLEHNKLKEVVKKKKSGGKGGGGGTTTKTYTYFATFALMLCQGEVAGVRRIWCGDKLLYNAGSDDVETIVASNKKAKGWKLYRGTDDQLPDPRYEADVGVGNAPAFRGYTYIVFNDFALADYSNTLQAAQFKVELQGVRSTSIQVIGRSDVSSSPVTGNIFHEQVQYQTFDNGYFTVTSSNISTGQILIQDQGFSKPIRLRAMGNGMSPPFISNFAKIDIDSFVVSGFSGGQNYIQCDDRYFYNPENFQKRLVKKGNLYVLFLGAFIEIGLPLTAAGPSPSLIKRTDVNIIDACISDYGEIITIQYLSGRYVVVIYNDQLVELRRFDSDYLNANSSIDQAGFGIYYSQGSIIVFNGQLLRRVFYFDDQGNSRGNYYELTIAMIGPRNGLGVEAGIVFNGYSALFYNTETHTGYFVNFNALAALGGDQVPLGEILSTECSLSELINPADVDTSLTTSTVTGYRVSGGAIRSVIEPLQGAYPFDVVPSGYKIKFVPRGQSPVVTIPWEDLAAANGDEIGDSLPYSREMDSQLPQKVTITALSSTREYGAATQSYERLNTSAVNVEQRDIPLVLSDDEIAQMSEKLLFLRWLERDDFDFSLPPTYQALEPADVVTVNAKFGTFELRITEINYEADGRLTCKAKANSAPLYTSRAVGAPGPGPSGSIGLDGPTFMVLVDGPMVYEDLQNTTGFSTAATGYTDGWPGGVLVRSNDDGQTWTELQGYDAPGTIGTARNVLAINSGALFDLGSSLTVDLMSGELESVTEEQMLNGANIAYYGADGRWEVVRFQNAALQADGSYVLTKLIRGDRGTEWATGLHQAGDTFVMADDPDNAFVGSPVESIGLQRLYRAVTSGASIDEAADQAFTYRGVNLKPLSPSYPFGSRNTGGDLAASWTRRSRMSSSWWVTGVASPVGEATEAYSIDVMSGSTVKRTIPSTTPAITYTAADQTIDFGSPQSAITLRIYQLSATVGRGYPLEVTL